MLEPPLIGGTGFGTPKIFYCYYCIKLMLMIRLKVCEVCDIYALGYELRVEQNGLNTSF